MNVSGERTRSLWMRTAVAPGAPRLEGKHSCDAVVVGAGIAGLSVAYELVAIAALFVLAVAEPVVVAGVPARVLRTRPEGDAP